MIFKFKIKIFNKIKFFNHHHQNLKIVCLISFYFIICLSLSIIALILAIISEFQKGSYFVLLKLPHYYYHQYLLSHLQIMKVPLIYCFFSVDLTLVI